MIVCDDGGNENERTGLHANIQDKKL